jgi:hypothetical protein
MLKKIQNLLLRAGISVVKLSLKLVKRNIEKYTSMFFSKRQGENLTSFFMCAILDVGSSRKPYLSRPRVPERASALYPSETVFYCSASKSVAE